MANISIKNIDLTVNEPQTFITADTASASGTLTVKNIGGFAVNQTLLLGSLGNEGSEIVKTHASTAPSGSTITLAANTVFPHSSSTPLMIMLYDQVEFSNATTIGGSKTVLATQTIDTGSDYSVFNDINSYSGYYFARFKNSISGNFSGYSDPIPTSGYTQLSARKIIDNALQDINKRTSDVLTDDYAFRQIDNCQMEVIRDLKRWSFMQKFDFNLGAVTTGQFKIALPADIDDANSNKSIYNFRIGANQNINWVDKEKWNQILQSVAHTTLASNINVSDATVTLTDSGDFPTSGTLTIGANQYTFIANNTTTNVLTLSTPSTTTNTAGQDAFASASTGMPTYWTTFGGYIYFYPLIDATQNNNNAYMDYYSQLLPTTTDTQTIVIPDPTVVQYYLSWKFSLKLNNGDATPETDAWQKQYLARKAKMIQKETANRTFQLKPRLNRFSMRDGDNKSVRLQGFGPLY